MSLTAQQACVTVTTAIFLLFLSSCNTSPAKQTVAAGIPQLPPVLLHLPGIGGVRGIDRSMIHGLIQGGFNGDVQVYDWTEKDAGLKALLDNQRHKFQAKLIASKLTAIFDADHTRKIYITSHSGGGGVAIWALEDLPARVKINTLLLMSPAISPGYDLTLALTHVTGRVYVFSSLQDPVLGWGCRTFGTMDGIKTDAAGRVGFIRPPTGDAAQYTKIVPMPYNPNWIYLDDYGDHVGGMNRTFARKMLAPLLLTGVLPEVILPSTQSSAAVIR